MSAACLARSAARESKQMRGCRRLLPAPQSRRPDGGGRAPQTNVGCARAENTARSCGVQSREWKDRRTHASRIKGGGAHVLQPHDSRSLDGRVHGPVHIHWSLLTGKRVKLLDITSNVKTHHHTRRRPFVYTLPGRRGGYLFMSSGARLGLSTSY